MNGHHHAEPLTCSPETIAERTKKAAPEAPPEHGNIALAPGARQMLLFLALAS